MGGGDGAGLNPLVIIVVLTALGVLIWWLAARAKWAPGRFAPTHRTPESALVLRGEPNDDADQRARIDPNTLVAVTARLEGWAHVTTRDGRDGWVQAHFITPVAGAKPLPAAQLPIEPEPTPAEEPQSEVTPLKTAAPPPEEPAEPRPAKSVLLALPSRFVDDFRPQMSGLSASLDEMVIRTGDRLQYAGIPLVVAAAGPADATITSDTIVRVRRVTGDITATCPRCATETILPAPACSRCSGPIATELTDSGSPPTVARAIEQNDPGQEEDTRPATSTTPTEPVTSARALTWDHWFALGGAIAIGVSAWIPWISGNRSYNGFDIRLLNVLLNDHGETGPAIAFMLIPVALIGLIAAASAAHSHRRSTDDDSGAAQKSVLTTLKLLGTLTVLFCLWFIRWIWTNADGFGELFDFMGLAPIIALSGAIVMIVSTRGSSTLQAGR